MSVSDKLPSFVFELKSHVCFVILGCDHFVRGSVNVGLLLWKVGETL